MTELIDKLANDLTPAPRRRASRQLLLLLIPGVAVSLAVGLSLFGLRSDFEDALGGGPFWMKLGTMIALGALFFPIAARLAVPGRDAGLWPYACAALVAVLLLAGGAQLALTPAPERMQTWLGHSWHACPWRVALLGLPILAAAIIGVRRLAPTRLRAAGAATGLFAGAAGAAAYSLSCGETSVAFLATWYLLGVLVVAGLGWLIGPRMLRW